MKTFKKQFWDQLLEFELNIFKTQEENEKNEYEAWEKENQHWAFLSDDSWTLKHKTQTSDLKFIIYYTSF